MAATVSNEEDIGWDDLDRDDDEDPLMVSEYAAEIYEYLRNARFVMSLPPFRTSTDCPTHR